MPGGVALPAELHDAAWVYEQEMLNQLHHCSLALWQVAAQVEALQAQVALARQVQLRHSTAAVQGLQEQLRTLTTRLAARQVRLRSFSWHARAGFAAASKAESSKCCQHLACNPAFHQAATVCIAACAAAACVCPAHWPGISAWHAWT